MGHYSREYRKFRLLQHWKPTEAILEANDLANIDDKYFSLFSYLYDKTDELNSKLPKRKNGDKPFSHPINVVFALEQAGIKNITTLCGGIIHDYIEDKVDEYKMNNNLSDIKNVEIEILDNQETKEFEILRNEILDFCEESNLDVTIVDEIIDVTKLLTRHKRDFYYRSMCHIFNYDNNKIKERAILIKLADRMHNILSIECFNEEERIYQCFKNLLILNNVKKYIMEKYGHDYPNHEPLPPLVKLFKRCGKATYDAFLKILMLCREKGIGDSCSMIQLAFKKFSFERNGTNKVTEFAKNETHLMRLYRGVVRKYDYRLRQECKNFNRKKEEEKDYCKRFFIEYNYNDGQISAIIDYKDAYGLKEVITYLLYDPEYFVIGFEYSNLFTEW